MHLWAIGDVTLGSLRHTECARVGECATDAGIKATNPTADIGQQLTI